MKIYKISQTINSDPIEFLKENMPDISELNSIGINFNKLDDQLVYFEYNDQIYIYDEFDAYIAQEWINNLSPNKLEGLMGETKYPSFNDIFWKNPEILYHGTYNILLDNILKDGLTMRNESRGVTNRGTPSAIFTTTNENGTDGYGNIILKIDTSKMKANGYTPYVEQESPITEKNLRERLAHKIGLNDFYAHDDYSSDGIGEETVVIFGNIPPQYISLYD
jgi:hypothetical protein